MKKRAGLIVTLCLLGVLAAVLALWCQLDVTFARGPYPFARSNVAVGRDPQAASRAEQRAAETLIREQLADVRRGDFAGAAALQASPLRIQFAYPGAFRRMIQWGYPVFGENREVEIGPVSSDLQGQLLLAPVVVIGKSGAVVSAIYLLIREGKQYRVQGVLGGFPPRPSRAVTLP